MKAIISKSKLAGRAQAPSSKSYTLRALICAALADGRSQIKRPLYADDTDAARDVLDRIGVKTEVKKTLWGVSGGNFRRPRADLFCRESAGTLRFMTAVCSLVPGKCRLTAGPSLARRPVGPLIDALQQIGVSCSSRNGLAPVEVEGGTLGGGVAELPGDISSQFVSALLMVAPLAPGGMTIKLTSLPQSKPYILMTIDCMRSFGIHVGHNLDLTGFTVKPQRYQPSSYTVEGDWSSASYLLALGAVAGAVDVPNLNPESRQGDKEIWCLLREMGAGAMCTRDSVRVRKSKLRPIYKDLSDCIDLLPTMAVLAATADGVSRLKGVARARLKESDRIAAVSEGLARMGIEVKVEHDSLYVTGGKLKSAVIDPKGDHRIAMAFSIPAMLTERTVIKDAGCVTKTYPEFWETLKSLGGNVTFDGK